MNNVFKKFTLMLVTIFSFIAFPSLANTTLAGFSSITYTWVEGAFKGDKYKLTILGDSKLKWESLAGTEKDLSRVEEKVTIIKLSDNRTLITWLEKVGYTVTLIINNTSGEVNGVVSNQTEHYVLVGKTDEIK